MGKYDDNIDTDDYNYDVRTRITPLKEGLDSVLGKLDPTGTKTSHQTEIMNAWSIAAGASSKKHTEAVFVRGSQLIVWLDSPIWAQEMSLMGDSYIHEVNNLVGREFIKTIRFEVRRRHS